MATAHFATARFAIAQSVMSQSVMSQSVISQVATPCLEKEQLKSLDSSGEGDRSEGDRLIDAERLILSGPSPEDGEMLRHILLGKAPVVRQTIHALHRLRYVELIQWSPLIEPAGDQLILTPRPGEVMSLLVRQFRRGDPLA